MAFEFKSMQSFAPKNKTLALVYAESGVGKTPFAITPSKPMRIHVIACVNDGGASAWQYVTPEQNARLSYDCIPEFETIKDAKGVEVPVMVTIGGQQFKKRVKPISYLTQMVSEFANNNDKYGLEMLVIDPITSIRDIQHQIYETTVFHSSKKASLDAWAAVKQDVELLCRALTKARSKFDVVFVAHEEYIKKPFTDEVTTVRPALDQKTFTALTQYMDVIARLTRDKENNLIIDIGSNKDLAFVRSRQLRHNGLVGEAAKIKNIKIDQLLRGE